MHAGIISAIVIGTVFLGIIGIIKAITDYQLKQKLISSGNIDPKSFKILDNQPLDSRFTALKWGLIAFFGGIGLVIIEIIDFSIAIAHYDRIDVSVLPFGIELVCISLGFLVYYFIVKNELEKKQRQDDHDQLKND